MSLTLYIARSRSPGAARDLGTLHASPATCSGAQKTGLFAASANRGSSAVQIWCATRRCSTTVQMRLSGGSKKCWTTTSPPTNARKRCAQKQVYQQGREEAVLDTRATCASTVEAILTVRRWRGTINVDADWGLLDLIRLKSQHEHWNIPVFDKVRSLPPFNIMAKLRRCPVPHT